MIKEEVKEDKEEEDKSATPEKLVKEEPDVRGGKKGKGGGKGASDKEAKAEGKTPQRKSSADGKKRQTRRGSMMATPPPGVITPVSDGDNQRSAVISPLKIFFVFLFF